MATYRFLSDEWIDAARAVRESFHDDEAAPAGEVTMNLVVVDMPFGESTLHAHLDTTGGQYALDLGHLEHAHVKVSLDYPTARAIIVDADGQVAMQAFMAGKIRVEGDMAKLLTFQATPVTGRALEAAEAIRAFTE